MNCDIFGDSQLNGNGNTALVPGICNGIQAFFYRRGLANSDPILTWDPDTSRATARRTQACPPQNGKGYCYSLQNQYIQSINDKSIAISCDEFPFASSEEGGSYLGSLFNNPTEVQRTCVPTWQQYLQGNCNSIGFPQLQFRDPYALTNML